MTVENSSHTQRPAVRFISDRDVQDPVGQLDEILQITQGERAEDGSASPYVDLDKLYLGVLLRAGLKNSRKAYVELIQSVIATVVCLRNPMSVSGLAKFISASTDDIRKSLRYLHSVIVVPDGPMIRCGLSPIVPGFPEGYRTLRGQKVRRRRSCTRVFYGIAMCRRVALHAEQRAPGVRFDNDGIRT